MSQEFLPFTRPSIDEQTIAGVAEVLRSGWITSGPQVQEFEVRLSAYFGGRPVRTLSSATGALEVGLALAGVGPGDEVITTPLSWVATANVIVRAGARPVFVDVDPQTRNIDLALLEAAITPLTRALLPVDLAGLPVDRSRLNAIARAHRLRVVEDAAQSMGASWQGERIGASGDLVSISFHANKNLTTAEGGCLVLNDAEEARRCELWRLQGVERFADGDLDVTLAGGKHNMTDIAARMGLGQLARLEEFTARRHALARRYFECFDRSLGCELPIEDFTNSNWHMFQIVLPAQVERGAFIAQMHAAGIGIGVHYPAIHLLTLYRQLGFKPGDFPIAEHIGRGIATLPLFPAMRDQDVERVCEQTARTLHALSGRVRATGTPGAPSAASVSGR
ncbi:MAG TPA: DegT/DnrJ/EryC1/StrS aminotransferase family protein [Steroidobacteraceae bacterium]|nr:DegT/DnrJ/EryC1/StrS aminotransferase family protein [Steroidobacteraceae bacterium]